MTLTTSFDFFQTLAEHNHRDWFNAHKEEYLASKEEFEQFIGALVAQMKSHDTIDEKHTKIYRIYKDVRFSKDKTPYKTTWSSNIKRATAALRGGYYLQVGPGRSFLAGGFFGPNAQDLLHIRKHLSQDAEALRAALSTPGLVDYFGNLQGAQLKSVPRGFSKDDDNIDLLRYKQLVLRRDFTDSQALDTDFLSEVDRGFRLMRPFLDAMSEVLTTDLNGLSLLD